MFKVTMFNNVLSTLLNIKQSREIIEQLSMDAITIKVNASNIFTVINSAWLYEFKRTYNYCYPLIYTYS